MITKALVDSIAPWLSILICLMGVFVSAWYLKRDEINDAWGIIAVCWLCLSVIYMGFALFALGLYWYHSLPSGPQ